MTKAGPAYALVLPSEQLCNPQKVRTLITARPSHMQPLCLLIQLTAPGLPKIYPNAH